MMRSNSWTIVTIACLASLAGCSRESDPGKGEKDLAKHAKVAIADTEHDHVDLMFDGKTAARYMYAFDQSTPERYTQTFKPFLHVFDADGKRPITNGAGGEFPHHRGIFIGWNKIRVGGEGGKTYDRWHMKTGAIVHQNFALQSAMPAKRSGTITAINHWNDDEGKPFVVEARTMRIAQAPEAEGRLVIDFVSKLTAQGADVKLDGDPEHSGIHYRPANDADRTKTVYVYPKENAEPHKDVDYAWVGETYTLKDGNTVHSVVQIDHPENPRGTKWSAYRNYGRFGAFPVTTIKAGESASFKYRFIIADGEMLPIETIQKVADEFTGAGSPTPAPKVTVLPAEQPKPKPATKPATKPTGEKPRASAGAATTQAAATTAPVFKGHPSNAGPVDAPILFNLPPPDPLSVAEALKTFALPEGLVIEPVASEPLVEDPIAISFDELGRMYVVEMRSYMQNVDGDKEDEPIGRIKRLTDTDGDGKFDKAEVFIDGLVMPRAVLAVRGGVLVGEPPELAFWEDTDEDGKADKKTIVATDYGRRGGQPEHMANTPTLNIDNWIYSSSHTSKFRVVRGKWISEPTRSRGQYGLSQDDVGRFFFSTNSDVARGDPLPGQYFSRNPYYKSAASQNVGLIESQEVWPSHPTPGVNRGYTPDQLRKDGTLATATAAGGSAIYRGDALPSEYYGNLFTPEPSGNLIKRMLLTDTGGKLAATNAYPDKDFLTSTDERFRPVQVCTGPDGALYVVDLYHGILQHRYFLTHYLIKNIKARNLETPIHWGRIYRIVPDRSSQTPGVLAPSGSSSTTGPGVQAPPAFVTSNPLPTKSAELIQCLAHPNGWLRDTAQRVLVERNDKSIVPKLNELAGSKESPLARLHALWTLEGMNRLTDAVTRRALADADSRVVAAAIRLSEPMLVPATRAETLKFLLPLASHPSADVQLQLVLSIGAIPDPKVEETIATLLTTSAADPDLMRDAVLSGLRGRELEFIQRLVAHPEWATESDVRTTTLAELARCVMNERRPDRIAGLIDVVGAETEKPWRQIALLTGMSPKVEAKAKSPATTRATSGPTTRSSPTTAPSNVKLIYLDAQPESLPALLASNDENVRTLAERAEVRLAWPGKPGVVPPAKVAPLTPAQQAQFEHGKSVYAQTCAACHQPTGLGLEGLAPPLVESEWVLGSPNRLARIVLHGVTGPIFVDGALYKMEMPALSVLPDADIAAVLTYIRREWDHGADPVDEKTVSKIRERTKDRADLWTAKELEQVK
jgi:putative membrane-bound dehydrogenase-like protein